MAESLLGTLGERLGLRGLCFDASGCCCLAFDRRWLVTLVLGSDRLLLHCPICTPETTRALDSQMLMTLLQGNFMGRGAAGGSLAIGPDQRACVQRELAAAEADAPRLLQAVEQLLDTAEIWAARLLASTPQPTAPKRRRTDLHRVNA